MKRLLYIVVLTVALVVALPLWGKQKLPPTVIRSWVIPHPLALADTVAVDSSFYNFPMRNELYDHSICNVYDGNLVSPTTSAVYFKRTHKTGFLFGDQYDIYTPTPQDVRFYNTTTPYSTISYKRGFKTYHEDEELRAMFTGNISPKLNLGFNMNLLNAVGHYANQAGKTYNGSVFGSYNGNHYSLQASFSWNRLSNFENFGLARPSDIEENQLKTEDLPVNLEAMSGYRYLAGYINHYYSICVEHDEKVHYRERDERGKWVNLDSIRTVYVPVMTFRHVFETNEQTHRYVEHSRQKIYPNCYRNPIATNDSAAALTIRNTLSATFEEEFNTRLKFGASVFAYHEAKRYLVARGQNTAPELLFMNNPYEDILNQQVNLMPDNIYGYDWKHNVYVGGELYKKRGRYIHYGFGGDVCLYGYEIGQFKVYGHLDAGFKLGKDSLTLDAQADFYNVTPDYYLQRYVGNHYRWNNDFDKPYHFRVGGQVAYPTQWVTPRVKVDYENITRHIYFEYLADGPRQMEKGKSANILSVDAQLNLTTPWFNIDNSVVYQYSSSYTVPVPTVALYTNLYYHGTWFKALDAQLGIDLRYNTAYYAPIWDPALGQFAVQQQQKVGNAPIMNAYVNFYVRHLHLRFFAQYEHFNASFMKRNYFVMPSYPLNPGVFRAGLAFHFYK